MKTKIILTINGVANELNSDCLKNWDEVVCDYKRTDYSGVIRSFSSTFEFVNDAYDMLLEAYLRDGVRAEGSVAIYLLNNDWSWSKEFEAALNFSTVNWDDYIFNINCIDDSLAALIKSRKGTKYEFEIGKDIEVGGILNYDRVTMQNSCAHEIMGESDSSGAVIITSAHSLTRLQVYSLTSETFENSPIVYGNQDTGQGSAFISTERSVSKMKMRLEIWAHSPGVSLCYAKSLDIYLRKFTGKDGNMTDIAKVFSYSAEEYSTGSHSSSHGIVGRQCLGVFRTVEELKRAYPKPPQDVWAKIGTGPNITEVEAVYITPISNKDELVQWEFGSYSLAGGIRENVVACNMRKYIMEFEFPNIPASQKFALFYTANIVNIIDKDPKTPQFSLFSKITTHWESKAKPIDIQALKPVKLVSSLIEKITDGKYNILPHFSDYDPRFDKTYLLAAESVRNIPGAKIYTTFNDFCDWMETVFGYVYTIDSDSNSIHFVHRSELFQNQDQGLIFYDAKDLHSKVNNSMLYSVVEVGYEKQDYETQCGRDEWNFMNYYNTGIDVIEKKLTLQSKYRADCYGFEFLAQERAKDSTDNKSDSTVFFVYTKLVKHEEKQDLGEAGSRGEEGEVSIQETTTLEIDRSVKIEGALSDTVFNGEFSPYYCVKANEGYISAMAPNVTLQFASSDGNSDIVIDGVKTTANIPLGERLFSELQLDFVGTDLDKTVDFSKLVKVVNNGLVFSGFFKKTECCYARPSEVDYTIIVKDIKPI